MSNVIFQIRTPHPICRATTTLNPLPTPYMYLLQDVLRYSRKTLSCTRNSYVIRAQTY